MLGVMKVKLARRLIETASGFVPRGAYEAKVARIVDQDAKNDGLDLQGWAYRRVPSTDGAVTHRYYHYPAQRPGAPAMVFLHGLNLDGRNFLGMKELAREYELFAYDFPEASPRYHGDIEDFAGLVDDFADVLGLASFTLVGVSLGGMIALRYAGTRQRPRPRALILISTMIPGSTAVKREQWHIVGEMVRSLEDYQLYWLFERLESRHFRKMDAAQRERVSKVLRPKQLTYYRQAAAALQGHNGLDDTQRITCPTLVILGARDSLIPIASAAEFRAAIPHARIDVIRGGQHDMSLQQPTMICEHIWSFVDGITACD